MHHSLNWHSALHTLRNETGRPKCRGAWVLWATNGGYHKWNDPMTPCHHQPSWEHQPAISCSKWIDGVSLYGSIWLKNVRCIPILPRILQPKVSEVPHVWCENCHHPARQGTPSSPPCAEKRVPFGGMRSDPDFQQLPRPSKPSHNGFVTDSVRMKMCVST